MMQEPSIDKLSYEIFSLLETKFLFEHDKPWKKPHSQPQRGKICILSIDGGGMRGILPGKALSHLEKSLKLKSQNPHATISDYFDVAAGTGTGGIFASMLFASRDQSHPIFQADDTWRILTPPSDAIFLPWNRTSHLRKMLCSGPVEPGLEEALRGLTLKDALKPLLVPCYNLSTSAPLLFSRADALESDGYDFDLWDVCRATSAGSGRCGPVDIRSVDGTMRCLGLNGGLTMVNPAAAAITHVLHNKQEFPLVGGVEDILVLSLGTGMVAECDRSRDCARISGDSAAEMVDQAVAMGFGAVRSGNYVRIQPNESTMGGCGSNVDTDSSPGNVKMLMGAAEQMLKQKYVESVLFEGKRVTEQTNMEKVEWFAGELVREHERRSWGKDVTVMLKKPVPKKHNTCFEKAAL